MNSVVRALIIIVVIVAIAIGISTITNRSLFDTTYSFERAMIQMPNGSVIEGRVQSWIDYEDGDQIQLRVDNKTYLTHISNVVLISE